MKDLDFDEIDRAVNSVISNNTSTDVKSEPSKTITDSVKVAPKSEPSSDHTPPSIVRRTSGHFMDVVHPSSDMRRSPINIPERASPAVVSTQLHHPIPYQTQPQTDTQAPLNTKPLANEVPIPATSEPTDDSYNDEDIDKISDEISKELGQKTDSAIESPFISGTKVEKRPLGAFSDDAVTETVEEDDHKIETDFAPNPVAEKPFSPDNTPLPAELSNDLLQIEADSTTIPEAISVPDDVVATKDEAAEKTEVNKPLDDNVVTPVAKVPVESSSEQKVPSVSVPIVKHQDDTQPVGGRDSGAIYDTNSYHKALVHPMKTKPRMMWVVYVAILLFVGAVVSSAVFFFVIPLTKAL